MTTCIRSKWRTDSNLHQCTQEIQNFRAKTRTYLRRPTRKSGGGQESRLLLLWVDDKGLEIYNTTTWQNIGDDLKLEPALAVLEANTKPQSSQILSRYQLRCLKQEDMPLKEFVTKASLLIEDAGYDPAVKKTTLRDTLVFGVTSGKVRKRRNSTWKILNLQASIRPCKSRRKH